MTLIIIMLAVWAFIGAFIVTNLETEKIRDLSLTQFFTMYLLAGPIAWLALLVTAMFFAYISWKERKK